MTTHDMSATTNHGGLIFPLEMFRASTLASAIAEGLLAKIKNIVDAQLILTRHAAGPLVLVRIDGAVMGEDPAQFWEENMDLALYASQALPRECFAYYVADGPERKQGLLIAQRGQVVAGDQATEETMPPEAGPDDWPLPRLCQQLGIRVEELADGFAGGPSAAMSLMEPSVSDDEPVLRTLAEQPAGPADDVAADPDAANAPDAPDAPPGPAAQAPDPRTAGAAPRAAAPNAGAEDSKRRAREASEEASLRQQRAQAISSELDVILDEHGAIVLCDAELGDTDILSNYAVRKVSGELPAGIQPSLVDQLQGKRIDFAVQVEFLSEVFIDDKPLTKAFFEAESTPIEFAGTSLRTLTVLAPRLGQGTLLRRDRQGYFVSRTSKYGIPSTLLERCFG
ncbi:MAG: hypothetical protein ACPHRO_01000, partial [Nannocystaceae bacterium]